jgi:hypothetical protein
MYACLSGFQAEVKYSKTIFKRTPSCLYVHNFAVVFRNECIVSAFSLQWSKKNVSGKYFRLTVYALFFILVA